MLVKEKYSMTNLKISDLNKSLKFVFIFIYFFSGNVASKENDIVKAIEKNWNETKTLSGQFNQTIDSENTISGEFFIEKPFKSSFTYHDQRENIITSKYFINVVDKQGILLNRYPIINQPIYQIFSDKINLENIFKVELVNEIASEITIELTTKDNKHKNGTKIIITFNSNDYLLKNWEIIDVLGQSTYLEFTNIRKNISIDQNLFIFKEKINY